MFCDMCGHQTQGCTEIRSRKINIWGTDIPVRYNAMICDHCGSELYDEDTEAFIMRIAREQYREKRNMLPASRLKAYMKSHEITPEQMAQKAECAVAEVVAASRGVLLDPKVDTKLKKAISA